MSIGDAKWILVVEKEAIFKLLIDSKIHENHSAGRGIIITGKGYPDFATRAFLRHCVSKLAANLSTENMMVPPVLGLFDYNPDGLMIFKIYQSGAWAIADQRLDFNVPEIQYTGLHLNQMPKQGRRDGLRRLTLRDRKKAFDMLRTVDTDIDDTAQVSLKRRLQMMLVLGYKAELEVMEQDENRLAGWISRMIGRRAMV
ncbi:MAG: hypothetical protein Q9227_004741 [Pyrenula ochraceoflavens]